MVCLESEPIFKTLQKNFGLNSQISPAFILTQYFFRWCVSLLYFFIGIEIQSFCLIEARNGPYKIHPKAL